MNKQFTLIAHLLLIFVLFLSVTAVNTQPNAEEYILFIKSCLNQRAG